jgi:hypothetical protein
MAPSSSDQLKYQWSRIINEGEEKIEDKESFKDSDSQALVIDGFEVKYAGIYRCVISTSSRPVVSMSAEVELDLPGKLIARCIDSIPTLRNELLFLYTEPPEEFSTKMSNKQFLLYLNTNGIYYDVCKKLEGKLEIHHHNTFYCRDILLSLSQYL